MVAQSEDSGGAAAPFGIFCPGDKGRSRVCQRTALDCIPNALRATENKQDKAVCYEDSF